jgi:hypothetical protein
MNFGPALGEFAEIKIEAEIKCGELLQEMAESGQRDAGGRGAIIESQRATQLADLGITKDESSRFQQAAGAPREQVEEALKAGGTRRYARPHKRFAP